MPPGRPPEKQGSANELDQILPPGMTEKAFREAILTSGYPLQIKAAAALGKRDFRLIEEWAYTDPDGETRRALDVFGFLPIGSPSGSPESGELKLGLALMIECKQSNHPLVFFESVVQPVLNDFPLFVGNGPARTVRVSPSPAANWTVSVPLPQFLGLEEVAFAQAPPVAVAMSRAEAKGSKVQVSGELPYRALSLPLAKALAGYREYWQESRNRRGDHYLLRLSLGIAVVDAPLVIVGQQDPEPTMAPASWVRLVIREPMPLKRDEWKAIGYQVIDVVHWRFFEAYLDGHLIPFAADVRDRITSVHGAVYSGEASMVGLTHGDLPAAPFRACVESAADV